MLRFNGHTKLNSEKTYDTPRDLSVTNKKVKTCELNYRVYVRILIYTLFHINTTQIKILTQNAVVTFD